MDCEFDDQVSIKEKTVNNEIPFAGAQNQLSGAKKSLKNGNFWTNMHFFIMQYANFLLNTSTPESLSERFFKQFRYTFNSRLSAKYNSNKDIFIRLIRR